MWSFKHYSQLILILSLLILPPPINFFFVPQNNKREKNISCIELLCVLILKNRQPYHKEQLPFSFRKKKIIESLIWFELVCWGHLRA